MLSLDDGYKLLKKYDIPIARYGLSASVDQTHLLAENFGFPLVLKIDSPDIVHKTEMGFIKPVYSEHHLKKEHTAIMKKARSITKNVNGVIVQEFVHGIESVVGGLYDSQFGRVVMFGSGGIFIEILKDVSFRLVPITEHDAFSMIYDTHIANVLNVRGYKIDIYSIANVIVNVARLMEKEKIQEIDINPLFLSNTGTVAADIRIIK